jgi:thymidylate kinase
MTVLVFEGPDNLGKSTIINSFVREYKDVRDICMMHSTGPHCKNGEDPFEYQKNSFFNKVKKIITLSEYNDISGLKNDDIVIMDRSWIGEYVYGQIYRNGNSDKILDMINDCNLMLNNSNIHCIFIRLNASVDFIISHDDNKSLTSLYDIEKKKKSVEQEIELFEDVFNKMKMSEMSTKMTINVQDTCNNYRSINFIYDEIKSNVLSAGIIL